jgi:hypothetical protein
LFDVAMAAPYLLGGALSLGVAVLVTRRDNRVAGH